MNAKNIFTELKRRNVYRAAVAYGVVAWFLTQLTTQVFPFFEIPNSAVRFVVIALAVGFPIAMLLSWVYELTPEGVVRTEDLDPVEARSVQRRSGRLLDFIIIGALLLVIAMLVVGRLPFYRQTGESMSQKSIAVLPFENLSEEKANAYFAEGIQNEILTRLATVRDLKVISRTSTAKYQSKPDNLKTVAQELGVSTILEGAVQKAGDKVRVNVQLIDGRADTHLWAKSYDRALKDVLEVESEVSQEIAEALQANLSPSESHVLASVRPHDTEAYDLFLRGEYEFHQAERSFAADAYNRADAFYRQALARDPNFAEAAAALAYSRLLWHWEISPLAPAELEEVKSLIDRALALAPNLPEAHVALRVILLFGHRQYEMALTEFNRTLELQPNNALARAGARWFTAAAVNGSARWRIFNGRKNSIRAMPEYHAISDRLIWHCVCGRMPSVPSCELSPSIRTTRRRRHTFSALASTGLAMSTRPGEFLMIFQRPSSRSISSATATLLQSALLMLSLVSRFTSTSCKDVSPMLSKLSTRKWPIMIVRISSSLSGASPFACWQGRLRQPNPQEKKRGRYSRPGSGSGLTTFWP